MFQSSDGLICGAILAARTCAAAAFAIRGKA
jgi:hypothetical protein